MARRIVDLSMPVHPDMLTFPRVPPPALCVYESHEQFAERIGAAAYGVKSLTGSYLIVQNDHVGTHLDARKHIVPTAGGPETIPLEWCYSDGVILDFRGFESGYGITADDVKRELDRIEVQQKKRDLVLNWTGAGEYNTEERPEAATVTCKAAPVCEFVTVMVDAGTAAPR
jgi:kynurenine formamidase